MGGLIRNSIILLSVSYVQHRIVMITGTVHIGGVDFRGGVGDWSIRAVCVKNIMETGVTNWQRVGAPSYSGRITGNAWCLVAGRWPCNGCIRIVRT